MAMATSSASTVSFSARPSAASAVRPCAAAGRARARAAAGESGKWWAPLLGWSGKADYIEAPAPAVVAAAEESEARRRPFVGGLTEEKARELRARMVETESFHDAMYHSAIASRLARSA
ncbi:uncharacterized protein [Oryza sativa Japonica Group]|uniref:Os05g0176700 protein n=5 Tax=Oryza TaxID=4527 RepID=Q0DKB7_ORYSJ|nr:uncharacterized protein LOC4337962 [Oryza sativa Japonica Group]KAB8098331.1 hypothetical protein EE612_027447 [Oryza sativa]AAT77346.1 unknown protein [Oryza sativa Japonica Group]BAF16706.1 Os05g0176700 [Oryza sativa Japonica Group]BAG92657.1 unnamed protein product [Oryza sativa Japonica Group]BAS92523.1 Os05g0176700 [Oryza sativa Japonica Group]|eukprot:NP_001054792.1 Os05g0176700 [Oryza sativa Japonica Group]